MNLRFLLLLFLRVGFKFAFVNHIHSFNKYL